MSKASPVQDTNTDGTTRVAALPLRSKNAGDVGSQAV